MIFDNPYVLAHGLLVGLAFGFLLQRGKVSRFNTIVGQFLFTDFTVLKIMFTAIIVGAIGVYGLLHHQMITQLPLIPSSMIGSAIGGIIFGCGMALLGYCPGTAIAAIAQGAKDATYGVLGMFVGTALFEFVYTHIYETTHADPTKETMATALNVSPWLVIAVLAVAALALFLVIEKFEKKQ